MIPSIISGNSFKDCRGSLNYNNYFDASSVKRIYLIENYDNSFLRQWQGHKVEQRWFSVVYGMFRIQLIKIDDWVHPSKKLDKITFEISNNVLDVLHVPRGYISSIQSLKKGSKLLVMADFKLNEIEDEFKFPSDYFTE